MSDCSDTSFAIERRSKGPPERWFLMAIAPDEESAIEAITEYAAPGQPCRMRPAPRWIVFTEFGCISYESREHAQEVRLKLAEKGVKSSVIRP